MIRFKKIILLITFAAFAIQSNGQADLKVLSSKALTVYKAGNKSLKKGDHFGAIIYFKKFLEINGDRIEKGGLFNFNRKRLQHNTLYHLAECYRLSHYYEMSEKTYAKVFEDYPEKHPESQFYLAHMQMMNGKYPEAKLNFVQFKKSYKESDSNVYKIQMKYYIVGCDSAIKFIKDTLDIKISHLDTSINKAHVDFAPIPLNDSMLLYGSLRSDSIVYVDNNDSNAIEPLKKMYLAKRTSDSTWAFIEEYEMGFFNKPETHNGYGTFSIDSQRFYFARGSRDWKNILTWNIYESKFEDGDWTEPVQMAEMINKAKGPSGKANNYHPAIGWDNKKNKEVIYFISDRNGGKGGLDIWYSEWVEKTSSWKKSKNAGSKINTKLNEMSPYYNFDQKTMYFSSQGWPGLGGYDIFSTMGELKEWTIPRNIGFPINTNVNEQFFVLTPDNEEGYFVSNRVGSVALKNPTCCPDIYHYQHNHYIRLGVLGNVYEIAENKELIDTFPSRSITLSLVLLDESIEGGEMIIKSFLPKDDGAYFFDLEQGKKYNLKARGENYFSEDFPIDMASAIESDTIKKDFFMKKFSLKPIVVQNIYYEFDKSSLLDSSQMVIDTTIFDILKNNPQIIAEIGSHTDSRGSDQYNAKLSQRRAQSVVDYLVSRKGVSRKRLRAKGYGEKQPIAPNQNKDGTDNPAGRQLNRRTEFRVIGKVKGISEIIYKQ